jgi:PHD/YefM family antitoxin component YafN of YafNO toxin-antitoxin module
MNDGPFQTLDAAALAQTDLTVLLCRTVRYQGRVEITNCDGGVCVVISKEELDSLEAALEILSNADGKAMHEAMQHVLVDEGPGMLSA